MKKFLVFSGAEYYPLQAWDNYRGSYHTVMDARAYIIKNPSDWYQIVDRDTERLVSLDSNEEDANA